MSGKTAKKIRRTLKKQVDAYTMRLRTIDRGEKVIQRRPVWIPPFVWGYLLKIVLGIGKGAKVAKVNWNITINNATARVTAKPGQESNVTQNRNFANDLAAELVENHTDEEILEGLKRLAESGEKADEA